MSISVMSSLTREAASLQALLWKKSPRTGLDTETEEIHSEVLL